MNKIREKKMSALGLNIAKSVYSEDMPKYTDISISELIELEKKGFEFFLWVKAYLHCLNACDIYDKEMSLVEAVATVTLSWLKPQGRSRESVLELIKIIGVENTTTFLESYESLHNVCWFSEADRNE